MINKVGFTSIFVKAKEIAAQGYSPLDVLKIAEENESIIEIKRKVLALSKSNAETCLEGLNKVKEHLYANSELEYKDSKLGIEDFSHLMSLRLTHKGIPFSKNNDHTFNISGLRGVPLSHNRLLLQYKNIELPPISINELALLLKGQTVERIAKAESFINELTAHQVSVHVCSLFEKRATTLALARGDFAVIQIRNETNTRFMIAHKDIKGKITSRDIGQNIGAVLEARRFKALSPQPVIFPPLISEINVKGVIYPVRPGEMVGTYVVQIGNFDVAPMYLKDLLEWANGPRLGSLEHI